MHSATNVTTNCRAIASMLSCALALMTGGCDPQVSEDYRGESLLTILGSVEILQQRPAGRLVPALMFGGDSQFRLVDVRVKGEFPSDFRIDIHNPPPDVALRPVSPLLDEPPLALGYITAVPADHPETLRWATFQAMGAAPSCEGGDCACEGRSCERESSWCTNDGECYVETLICPRADSPDRDCELETEGDPTLKLPPWQMFAGFSQNYLVAYLGEPAPAGSYTAFGLGATTDLAAGYHLVAVRALTDEETGEAEACEDRAESLAVARVNERRGTDFRLDEITSYACFDAGDCADGAECEPIELEQSRFCALTDEERSDFETQFSQNIERAKIELRCPPDGWRLTHVPDPTRERISIVLAPDANPWTRSESDQSESAQSESAQAESAQPDE